MTERLGNVTAVTKECRHCALSAVCLPIGLDGILDKVAVCSGCSGIFWLGDSTMMDWEMEVKTKLNTDCPETMFQLNKHLEARSKGRVFPWRCRHCQQETKKESV